MTSRRMIMTLATVLPLAACATGGQPTGTAEAIGSIAATYLVAKYLERNPERAGDIVAATDAIMAATGSGAEPVSIAVLRGMARDAIGYDKLGPADQMALTQLADLLQADLLRAVDGRLGAGELLPDDMRARVYELAYMLNVAAAGVRDA